MKELQRIEMSEKLLKKINEIDEALNQRIQQFVNELQQQRGGALSNLVEGYLIDKDYPEDSIKRIEDNHIVFYSDEPAESPKK